MHLRITALLAVVCAAPLSGQTAGTAPCNSPEYRQLDFWVGDWDLEFTNSDGSIGKAANRITSNEYGSCVILERFELKGGGPGGTDFIGTSYSTYDAQTKSWRQVWVDNQGGFFDLKGGVVTGQPHTFEFVNIEPRGPRNATMRMIFQDVSRDALTWKWQRQQPDSSWVDQWVLRYKRRAPSSS